MRQTTIGFAKKQKTEPAPDSGVKSDMSLDDGLGGQMGRGLNAPLLDEQDVAIEAACSGHNVFITGSGGVGKSYTLRTIIERLREVHGKSRVFVTASTGLAATHVCGTTLHYFAGLGLGQGPLEQLLIRVRKHKDALERWRAARVLIIDEVSMVPAAFFETLDAVAKKLRKRPHEPFGGIQVVACGDFLQLPAIEDGDGSSSSPLLFETRIWRTMFPRDRVVLLRRIRRQRDQRFIDLLQAVRKGEPTEEHVAILESRIGVGDDHATRLYTHRNNVVDENNARMARIPGQPHVFKAKDTAMSEALLVTLDKGCQASASLTLKVGAQVVLLKNLDFQQSLVNGSRGVVVDFALRDSVWLPVVRFYHSDAEVTLEEAEWKMESGEIVVASRKQIPLALCWASTIHKAMGMTLDSVVVSLRNVFEYGQAYTALSRCSSLGGLVLLDLDVSKIRAEPRTVAYYDYLERSACASDCDRVSDGKADE